MVKLSQQLQERDQITDRPTRTERLAQQQKSLRDQREAERQARIDQEVEEFGEKADYENYEEKYKQLSPDAQQRVLSPEQLKETEGYQKYSQEKAEYEKQLKAYQEAQAYNRDVEIATKFFRKGLSGSMLANKRQKEIYRKLKDSQYIYQQKLLHPERYSTDLEVYKKNPELKQAVISGEVTPKITTDYGQTKVEFVQNVPTADEQYKAWQEERGDEPLAEIEKVEKKTTVIDRGLSKVKSFFTGWSLDVTGTTFPKLTISRKQEGDAGQELATSLAKAGYEKIKTGYEMIPDADIYIKQPSLTKVLGVGGMGGLSFYPTSDQDIKLKDVKSKATDYLTEKQETAYQEDLEKIGLEDIETKAQAEYQARFEDKYMKKLIYDEISFEEASKEFEKSEEAKQIQKNYENTIKNELMDLGFTKQGFVQAGAGVGKSVLFLVPTTAKGTILTAGAVYGGYSALKLIPPVVAYTGTGVIGAYGGYKALSPTSDPTERAGGVITAGISALAIGYGGYKYLRRPVVTTQKVKVPVKAFKRSKVIGFEDPTKQIVKIGGKTYTIEKTYFSQQKLSRQVIEGRRTVVTSQWRTLLKKYTRLNIKSIYEGVPYTDQAGYSSALKKLTKYGYTESQARATLRFYQPKVIDTTLKKGIIKTTTVEGRATARGEFDILTEQPKIKIDESLGISTRYAKTKIDYYDFERSMIKTVSGKDLIRTDILKTSPYAKLGKRTTRFEEYSVVESGDIEEGVIKVGQGEGFDVLQKAQYQDLKSIFAQRQILPLQRKLYLGKGETRIIKTGEPQVIEYDLDEMLGISKSTALQPANIKKTPLAKTFGAKEEIKKLLSTKQQRQPSAKDVERVINKLEQGSTSSAYKSTSQYYGTGQYERTIGGVLPKESLGIQNQLKDLPLPNIQQQVGIKDLILLKQSDTLALNIGAIAGLQIRSGLKADQGLKANLKVENTLKNLIKGKLDVGVKQEMGLKQTPVLKTDLALKTQLKSLVTNINLKTPTLRSPDIKPPVIRPVTLPPFLLKGKIAKQINKRRKADLEFAYLPDFTARAIGLDPETLTQTQATKRLKKLLTGLEIRRAVKIKNVF